jgi:hypothetical protein
MAKNPKKEGEATMTNQQVSIFEDVDYTKLRERIRSIETVDEALALLNNINVAYQLSQWAIVDIIYHFQQHHPHLLPSLESGLIWTLHLEPPQISQLKRVASVFGDVDKRFPALSFTHHILLAYATAYLEWEEITRIAKEAEYNAWGVRETRFRINQLRKERLLKEIEKGGKEVAKEKKRGRTPAVVEEVEQEALGKPELASAEIRTEPAVEVDLRKEVELRETAKDEEKKQILTDVAIRAADAYIRYGAEFLDYLLEALTTVQWDFYRQLTVKMKKRIPMLAAAKTPVADICSPLSALLDLLLKYREENNHEEDSPGREAKEV